MFIKNATGRTAYKMVKVWKNGLMALNIRVSIRKEKSKVEDVMSGKTKVSRRVA